MIRRCIHNSYIILELWTIVNNFFSWWIIITACRRDNDIKYTGSNPHCQRFLNSFFSSYYQDEQYINVI